MILYLTSNLYFNTWETEDGSLGEEKAQFDQQPIEAMWMTIAAEEALKLTVKSHYRRKSRSAVEWF